jgi:hypothetical protein
MADISGGNRHEIKAVGAAELATHKCFEKLGLARIIESGN